MSRSILEQGGDYFWVVKDNQPGVRKAVSLLFEHPPWGEGFGEACLEGRHGDRWEHRRLWASVALNGYLGWPGWDGSAAWNEPGGTRGQQEAQRQGDGGAGLRHYQPPTGTGGCCQVAGDLAGVLEDRKPAALGAGCGIRRGLEPGEDWGRRNCWRRCATYSSVCCGWAESKTYRRPCDTTAGRLGRPCC